METDGGGWTLVGYAENGDFRSFLFFIPCALLHMKFFYSTLTYTCPHKHTTTTHTRIHTKQTARPSTHLRRVQPAARPILSLLKKRYLVTRVFHTSHTLSLSLSHTLNSTHQHLEHSHFFTFTMQFSRLFRQRMHGRFAPLWFCHRGGIHL